MDSLTISWVIIIATHAIEPVYIEIRVKIYKYVYIYLFYTYFDICIHKYIFISKYTHTYIHIHIYIQLYISYLLCLLLAGLYIYVYIYMYIHMYTCIYPNYNPYIYRLNCMCSYDDHPRNSQGVHI
jgi:hypothetical protein